MKKKIIILFVFIIFVVLLFFGLEWIKFFVLKNQKLDYSEYAFVDTEWENGDEVIYFDSNGEFVYYEYSGSPVDDYDLCDTYVYDEISNKIKLICDPDFKGIELLRLVSVDDDFLKLKFGNKIETFNKVVDYSEEDYDFIDLGWTRKENGVKEILNIWEDGMIQYSYEITGVDEKYNNYGVFDKKICKGNVTYQEYDDESETYTIHCSKDLNIGQYYKYDAKENMIKIFLADDKSKTLDLKIIYSDENTLKLDFDGEIKEFTKE